MQFSIWSGLDLFSFFLVFLRIIAFFMIVPAFGDSRYISGRVRIVFAFVIAFLTRYVILLDVNFALPESIISLTILIVSELLIGCYMGIFLSIIAAALNVIGFTISSSISLTAANALDPSQSSQGTLIGNFLTITFIVLIFAANVDHYIILLILKSYENIPIGGFYSSISDITTMVIDNVQNSWFLAIKLSLSVLMVSFVINISAGLISRLMPQMNVFFVVMPVQILIGFFVLLFSFSSILLLFITEYEQYIYRVFG